MVSRIGTRLSIHTIIYLVLLAAYILYAVLYIAQTGIVVDDVGYFTLLDDAMISMRYAKNLTEGYGLVFNPGGERVEGYTNLLWVLIMVAVHLLPIAQTKICLAIQILGGLFGLLNLVLIRRLANYLFPSTPAVSLIAAALTAFYLPLNTWNLQGMEVSVLACVMTLSCLWSARVMRTNEKPVWLFVLLGASTLIRLDMVVPCAVVLLYLLRAPGSNWRRTLLLWAVVIGAFLAAQTLFRVLYYGDILPNTYYLKMTGYPAGLRIARGFEVFIEFFLNMYLLPLLLPLVVLVSRPRREVTLLLALFGAQLAYSIYVGGDVWDWWGGANRFVSIGIPVFFVLYGHLLVRFGSSVAGFIRLKAVPSVLTVLLVCLSMVAFNSLRGSDSLRQWLLLDRPLHYVDNENMIRRARLVTKITEPNATIAVTWAGAIPYFANRHTVDLLGKNDHTIARQASKPDLISGRFPEFLPGHMKRDYDYSLGKLKPDVIVQLWKSAAEASRYLGQHYQQVRFGPFIFSLRKNSTNIKWEHVLPPQGK